MLKNQRFFTDIHTKTLHAYQAQNNKLINNSGVVVFSGQHNKYFKLTLVWNIDPLTT